MLPGSDQEVHTKTLNRLLINVVLSVAVLFFLFLVTEVFLRIVYHPENLGSVVRFDRDTGWSLRPKSYLRSVDSGRGLDYRIRINSLGMREREITIKKPSGKKRILILGDSIGFGTGIDVGERFSDILGDRLGDSVEVVNCSVCGWGTDQELLYFELFARRLDSDFVVLQVTLNNDVLNNMYHQLYLESAPKPHFLLAGDSLILEEDHVTPPKLSFRLKVQRFLKKSRFLVFIKRRLLKRKYHQIEHREVQVERGFEKRRMEEDFSYWSVYKKEYGRRFESGWLLTEAILDRFISACRREGSEPVIFAFPLKLEVDDTWRNQLYTHTGIDSTHFDFYKPYHRLSSFCAARNVEFVYPLKAFIEASQKRRLYFKKDSHPNHAGHALAADALFPVLEQHI